MEKHSSGPEQPTAPPSEESQGSSGPRNQNQGLLDTRRIEHSTVLQAPPPPGYNPQVSGSDQPPPYQEAVNYPSVPAYQPNTFPKPQSDVQHQPHHIYPPTAYQSYPHYNATGGAAPTTYVIQTPVPQPTITVISPGNCNFCLNGRVENETDLCCLLCLIVLAIFTFPFGLVLLCCIPCTTRKRCQRCRRMNG